MTRQEKKELKAVNQTWFLEQLGDPAKNLRSTGSHGYRVNLNTGQISDFELPSWFKASLVGFISYVDTKEVNGETLEFTKSGTYNFGNKEVGRALGIGKVDYTTRIEVFQRENKTICRVIDGRDRYLVSRTLNDPINASKLSEAKADLNTNNEDLLIDYLSTKEYHYDYIIPDLEKGQMTVEILPCELLPLNRASLNIAIKIDGERIDESHELYPSRITFFPEDGEGRDIRIGDAWFGDEEQLITNDARRFIQGVEAPFARFIRDDQPLIKVIVTGKDSKGLSIKESAERRLTELAGHFDNFDYGLPEYFG